MPVNINLGKGTMDQELLQEPLETIDESLREDVGGEVDLNQIDSVTQKAAEQYKLNQIGQTSTPEERYDEVIRVVAQDLGYTPEEVAKDPVLYREAAKRAGEQLGTTDQFDRPYADLRLSEEPQGLPGTGPLAQPFEYKSPDQEVEAQQQRDFIYGLRDQAAQYDQGKAKGLSSAIDQFINTSNQVHQKINNLSTKIGRDREQVFSSALSKELKLDPQSVAEYVNGFVTNYAYANERGMPEAFTDLGMAAMLKVAKDNQWVNERKSDDPTDMVEDDVATEMEQANLSSATDERVGRLMHRAMGIQSTPTMDSVAGAMMRKTMTDATDLFTTAKVALKGEGQEGRSANLSLLTSQGRQALESMGGLVDTMLPTPENQLRLAPKTTKANIKGPSRKTDKSKDYGDMQFVNDTVDVLDNNGYKLAYSGTTYLATGNVIELISSNRNAVSMDRKEFLNIRKDAQGNPLEFITTVDGRQIKYLGNQVKLNALSKELAFAKFITNKAYYLNHKLGFNNRFYASGISFEGSVVGNYQGSKVVRAMLESPVDEVYNLSPNSQDVIQLKAGIMRKFGSKADTYEQAVKEFDNVVKEWQGLMATEQDTFNNAEAIAAIAADEEGYMSISAMVEAVKLQNAIDGKFPQYRSSFLTEIDGIANGIAHNILQAGGSYRIENAVGVFTDEAVQAMKDGTFEAEDVYEITADSVLNVIGQGNYKPEVLDKVITVMEAFQDGQGQSLINRKFGKKPLMIFGYGAQEKKIREEVGNWVQDQLLENPNIERFLADAGVEVDFAKALFSKAAWASVQTDFGAIKRLNTTLQGLAAAALQAGIDPVYTTREGHKINLGLFTSEVDMAFKPVPITYKGKSRAERVEGLNVAAYTRKNYINAKYNRGSKAAKQAGVLTTQSQDGINIGLSMQAMAELYGGTLYGVRAAQIFDAILSTPKHANRWSKQLNSDFYKLNEDWSMVEEFAKELKAQGVKIPKELQANLEQIKKNRRGLFKMLQSKNVQQFPWFK